MARTALNATTLVRNGEVDEVTNAVDPTNGHAFDLNGIKSRRVTFRINSTFAGAKTFTFKAGASPNAATPGGAQQAGQGDLVVSLNAKVGYVTVTTSRFKQADGKIYIDVAAAATGDIEVLVAPALG